MKLLWRLKKQIPMFWTVKILLPFGTVVKYFLIRISKNWKRFGLMETNYYSSYAVHSKSAGSKGLTYSNFGVFSTHTSLDYKSTPRQDPCQLFSANVCTYAYSNNNGNYNSTSRKG